MISPLSPHKPTSDESSLVPLLGQPQRSLRSCDQRTRKWLVMFGLRSSWNLKDPVAPLRPSKFRPPSCSEAQNCCLILAFLRGLDTNHSKFSFPKWHRKNWHCYSPEEKMPTKLWNIGPYRWFTTIYLFQVVLFDSYMCQLTTAAEHINFRNKTLAMRHNMASHGIRCHTSTVLKSHQAGWRYRKSHQVVESHIREEESPWHSLFHL